MKNNNKLIICLAFIVSMTCYAQEYKFGKVSKEELLETVYDKDSSANAVVLYEKKNIHFEYNKSNGFEVITEVFKRIKLYNKEGYENATEEIYLYKNNSDKERVSNLKGVTYSLTGGNVTETKLKKDGIFEEEFSENRDLVKFTMPSLQEGSVIEYKYKIISPFNYYIDRIYLQYNIPIKKISVKVETPEYFNFKKRTVGYLPINLKESNSNGEINFVSKYRSTGRTSSTSYSNSTVDYVINVNAVGNTNVPAFKKEPFDGNSDNYISSLVYELQSTKFPNSTVKNYSTTWEDVAKKIYSSSKFGGELKKVNYFKEDIDQLISGVSDPKKKAGLIYTFVKKKMVWNKKNRVYANGGVKKAYKEGTGNAAEINLMLMAMLKYAKVDTNPILVSTSDRLISLFPTLNGFNYVIARVKLPDGNILYLDATDKHGLPNILPNRVIQGAARIIAKNGTSQYLNLRPKKASANQYSMQYDIDDQGTVVGKLNMRHKDYLAHSFRVNNSEKDIESNTKRLQKRYEITEVNQYTQKGVKEYGKGVNERFSFSLDNQVEAIDGEMFFTPLLFLRDKENIFKSDERKYPIDFAFGYSNAYVVNIKIPEGYEIVEFPKSEKIKMPEGLGEFSFISSAGNGFLQLRITETINSPLILAEHYPVLKQFYNKLVEKENEQVVLKKI
ncbi:uncharacterized protein DUF3857 [Aquimarina sp. MAR_2010_214]|uniref:DUF3857 domain-containing protein n=1 Tax=Aquimarina sp. MAR_2010_214 TaxID=1250026 RepID=UPI000C70914B|nr:DUF3857 domain-containing protein [Aquimarina sp. MAR_2010_214]PKV49655.1 uncharacterized protein DUF3857 [Aquimarina sp. MAR_2010_214]